MKVLSEEQLKGHRQLCVKFPPGLMDREPDLISSFIRQGAVVGPLPDLAERGAAFAFAVPHQVPENLQQQKRSGHGMEIEVLASL